MFINPGSAVFPYLYCSLVPAPRRRLACFWRSASCTAILWSPLPAIPAGIYFTRRHSTIIVDQISFATSACAVRTHCVVL